VAATALTAIGVVMVATTTLSPHVEGPVVFLKTPLGRQCIFVGLGFGTMAITALLAKRLLASEAACIRIAWLLFLIVAVGLALMVVPGFSEARRGSHRWFSLSAGGMQFSVQPSEFAKLSMIGVLCALLARRDADPRSLFRGFLPAAGVVALTVALVGKEDFGTCALLSAVAGALMLTAGCRLRHLLVIAAIGVLGLIGLIVDEPYRMQRIIAFSNIWADPRGSGYQPLQSLTTIAAGGWFGTGLGAGIQKHGYLPESHTDFIFAVICEEMGTFGGLVVLALYGAFVYIGRRIAMGARTRVEHLLATGITFTIGLQAAMNIAVVTVLAPTTGISLPFISAGGSGVVVFCIATGLLAAIAARASDSGAPEIPGSQFDSHEASGAWNRHEA
jgi:cell division protein FtsW